MYCRKRRRRFLSETGGLFIFGDMSAVQVAAWIDASCEAARLVTRKGPSSGVLKREASRKELSTGDTQNEKELLDLRVSRIQLSTWAIYK